MLALSSRPAPKGDRWSSVRTWCLDFSKVFSPTSPSTCLDPSRRWALDAPCFRTPTTSSLPCRRDVDACARCSRTQGPTPPAWDGPPRAHGLDRGRDCARPHIPAEFAHPRDDGSSRHQRRNHGLRLRRLLLRRRHRRFTRRPNQRPRQSRPELTPRRGGIARCTRGGHLRRI